MDRGRMIDHTQNVNARNFDNFAKGKTSIKLFHPPGGEDHLQLGWDYDEPEELNIKKKQEPKKPRYEPSFVMPKKEYTKSYHVNKYIVDEEDEKEKIKKYKLQKKKSFSNEQQKIKPNTKNENTKKAIEEIKNSRKRVYLIRQDKYAQNWQNPTKVTNFVKSNLQKVDSVYIYDCYVTDVGYKNWSRSGQD